MKNNNESTMTWRQVPCTEESPFARFASDEGFTIEYDPMINEWALFEPHASGRWFYSFKRLSDAKAGAKLIKDAPPPLPGEDNGTSGSCCIEEAPCDEIEDEFIRELVKTIRDTR